MPLFADVAGPGLAHLDLDSLGFMDMAAIKVGGLLLLNELTDGMRAGMQAGPDLVERGAIRRRVADQDERSQIGKLAQPIAELGFAVLPGRVEGSRIRVPQARHLPFANLDVPFVKIVKPKARAHGADL